VAPVRDPLYQQARPTLALRDGMPLAEGLALHPALAPLLPLWQSRRLALALGVGWPTPNRSHFKLADQWASGLASGEGPGWRPPNCACGGYRGWIRRWLFALATWSSRAFSVCCSLFACTANCPCSPPSHSRGSGLQGS